MILPPLFLCRKGGPLCLQLCPRPGQLVDCTRQHILISAVFLLQEVETVSAFFTAIQYDDDCWTDLGLPARSSKQSMQVLGNFIVHWPALLTSCVHLQSDAEFECWTPQHTGAGQDTSASKQRGCHISHSLAGVLCSVPAKHTVVSCSIGSYVDVPVEKIDLDFMAAKPGRLRYQKMARQIAGQRQTPERVGSWRACLCLC